MRASDFQCTVPTVLTKLSAECSDLSGGGDSRSQPRNALGSSVEQSSINGRLRLIYHRRNSLERRGGGKRPKMQMKKCTCPGRSRRVKAGEFYYHSHAVSRSRTVASHVSRMRYPIHGSALSPGPGEHTELIDSSLARVVQTTVRAAC